MEVNQVTSRLFNTDTTKAVTVMTYVTLQVRAPPLTEKILITPFTHRRDQLYNAVLEIHKEDWDIYHFRVSHYQVSS